MVQNNEIVEPVDGGFDPGIDPWECPFMNKAGLFVQDYAFDIVDSVIQPEIDATEGISAMNEVKYTKYSELGNMEVIGLASTKRDAILGVGANEPGLEAKLDRIIDLFEAMIIGGDLKITYNCKTENIK